MEISKQKVRRRRITTPAPMAAPLVQDENEVDGTENPQQDTAPDEQKQEDEQKQQDDSFPQGNDKDDDLSMF